MTVSFRRAALIFIISLSRPARRKPTHFLARSSNLMLSGCSGSLTLYVAIVYIGSLFPSVAVSCNGSLSPVVAVQ
jgi:hypothetical protein